MLALKDKSRYGKFSADCDELGKVIVEICDSGFGEIIELVKNGKTVESVDTLDMPSGALYEEDDGMLSIGEYHIRKPFGKCLKRY